MICLSREILYVHFSAPSSHFLLMKHFVVSDKLVEYIFLTHPCRRQPLKICFITNDRGRSLFEAFDWLFICVDPCEVRDLRVKVVVEIEPP